MYSLTVRPCDLETRVSGLKTTVYRVIHEDLSLGSETWHRKTIRKIFSKSGHRHKGLDLGITIFCEVLTTPTSQANSRTRRSVPIKFRISPKTSPRRYTGDTYVQVLVDVVALIPWFHL